MRVAIVGAGGVGGLLAGLLARAGEDVQVVARGASLAALREQGLAVDSPLGRFTVRVPAADDPAALKPAEAVLVAVKAWQVGELAPTLRPLLAPGAVVVPLQNGVEAADRLAAGLGPEAVAGGIIHVLAWLDGPGRVHHGGYPPRVTMGEWRPAGRPDAGGAGRLAGPLTALAAVLERAGVGATVVDDVERVTWEKLMLVEPWGVVGGAARAPLGVLRTVEPTRTLLQGAVEEVAAVARARGVRLAADAAERIVAHLDGVAPEATVSMQRDLGAGRPSELDDQTGAVLRLAGPVGVPVPLHAALHAALLPQELAARGAVPRFPRT